MHIQNIFLVLPNVKTCKYEVELMQKCITQFVVCNIKTNTETFLNLWAETHLNTNIEIAMLFFKCPSLFKYNKLNVGWDIQYIIKKKRCT